MRHARRWRLYGRIHTQDRKEHVVDRSFEGSGDPRTLALRELAKRPDKGAPWYGDAVTIRTPEGQEIVVDVPWPGE